MEFVPPSVATLLLHFVTKKHGNLVYCVFIAVSNLWILVTYSCIFPTTTPAWPKSFTPVWSNHSTAVTLRGHGCLYEQLY